MTDVQCSINYKKLILIEEGWVTYFRCINNSVVFDEIYLINPSFFNKLERKKYNIKQINIKLLQNNLASPTIKDNSIVFCSGFMFADINFQEYKNILYEEIEFIKKLQNYFNCTIYYKKHYKRKLE